MGALTNEGTDQLTITPAQYRDAFDAAAQTAREMGYKVVVVDRSNGIIETEPRHAGGALEPWRFDNDGFEEATANTIASRRRRIRFEFVPVGAHLDAVQADPVLHGPAIPGSTRAQDRFDVQTCTGPIDMDVVRALSTSDAYSDFQVSTRRESAKIIAPNAPIAAPSVAVKAPA